MNRDRGIRTEQIDAELTRVGLSVHPGPLGYDLGGEYRDLGPCRLQRGSGVAGRGHAWCIVYVRGFLSGRAWSDMPYVGGHSSRRTDGSVRQTTTVWRWSGAVASGLRSLRLRALRRYVKGR